MLVHRLGLDLRPDPSRVILRSFRPATEPTAFNPTDTSRANRIVDDVLSLGGAEALRQADQVMAAFGTRHRDIGARFAARAAEVLGADPCLACDEAHRLLIGAYFLHEYAFASAALFNPSIVAHPDQSGAPEGGLRFILSLRTVGEGHISSLTFRAGTVLADGSVDLDPPPSYATLPMVRDRVIGPGGEAIALAFDPAHALAERVIFPVTPPQSNGIEDARFVRFAEDGAADGTKDGAGGGAADGQARYYATYTAYSGRAIQSELLETDDFMSFRLSPMTGSAVRNKGMALFPRRLGGRYAMIGRQDNENLYLLHSDDPAHWQDGERILAPRFPWEFVQIGNCGAPIELDEGWLLLTHGVGPVRQYAIGAVLLDKAEPTKVLGRTPRPLVQAPPGDRDGYVPNVVYTCGALRHGALLVLPYGVCDSWCTVATVALGDLLAAMEG